MIRLGSRGSQLALTQAEMVRGMLWKRFPELAVEIVVIKTEGDIDRDSPLSSFGGRGAFVRSIENALLNDEIDIAVHSLKDLPSRLPEGLTLGASPVREDQRDALIACGGFDLDSIPEGGTIATGSDRRRIQLRAIRPDLTFRDIRGNIDTRIRRLGEDDIDGVVLAYAALRRLGLESQATDIFEPEAVLPAPCQGALGLECRDSDAEALRILAAVEDKTVRVCVDAERAFIAELGMGCHAPVAALAVLCENRVRFSGLVGNTEEVIIRGTVSTGRSDAIGAARNMAREFKERMGHT